MEEFLHPSDDLNEPLPPESQALLDRFKAYAVWHPRLLQVRTQVLDTVWEPADVVFVVVCGPSGVGKSKLAEVLTNRLNTPKPELNGQNPRRALLINTRPPDGELFHRTNFYQKGLTLLGKTTFDRHIKLEAARWLESKVQEVQCSTCGSVSKAKLKEQSVVISPHPPRKSRPVRNVTRWMEQESDWVLVQKKE